MTEGENMVERDEASEFATPKVLFMAKAMWSTRQAAYSLTALASRNLGPLLKDWDDCPKDTKLWMCNEARAALNAYEHWDRTALSHPNEEGEGK